MLVLAVVACLARGQDTTDALRAAIQGKTADELNKIIMKVHEAKPGSIEIPDPDSEADVLRAIVFEHAQRELPPPGGIKPWIEGQPLRSSAKEAPKPKAKVDGSSDGMDEKKFAAAAKMLFKKLDVNKDKKLTREEMASMVEEVNRKAKEKGEPESDLFTSLDVNQDGFVEQHETLELFKRVLGMPPGQTGAKVAANTAPQGDADGMARMMFQAMDKDGDGKLSEKEMAAVIEQTKAEAVKRGSDDYVDFASLDANKDGFIDQQEAARFFAAMAAQPEETAKREKEEKTEL